MKCGKDFVKYLLFVGAKRKTCCIFVPSQEQRYLANIQNPIRSNTLIKKIEKVTENEIDKRIT